MWAFGIIMEFLLAIVCAAFAVTQILWPALTKRPLFPSFRRPARELNAVEEEIYDTELAVQIQQKRQELEDLQRLADTLRSRRINR
jgi:hypothetical protein